MPLDSDGRTGRHNRPARLVMTAFLLSGDAFLCVDVPFNEVANRAAQYGDDHFTPGSEVRFPCASDFSTQLMNTVVFSLAHYVVKTSRRSSRVTLYSFERPDPLKSMGWTVLKRFLSKVHKGIIDKRRLRRLEAAAALATGGRGPDPGVYTFARDPKSLHFCPGPDCSHFPDQFPEPDFAPQTLGPDRGGPKE